MVQSNPRGLGWILGFGNLLLLLLLKGGIIFKPGDSNEPLELSKFIYIIFFKLLFWPSKIKIEHVDPKVYLNPIKINLNMIILMLLSQYFHNKCYMASCSRFYLDP